MPQLPTSKQEEYGAEDEIMRFHQEDECSDTSTVDVVNDIKDDLLNEDGPDSGKSNDDHLYRNHTSSNRYNKESSHGSLYGSPAAVIVGPHRYYDHPPSYRPGSNSHPPNFPNGTQIRMPVYPREDRPYYEPGPWPPSQVAMPPHYGMQYGNVSQKYGYRGYPPGIPPGVPYYGPGHGYPGMPGRPTKEQKRPHVKKPLNAFMLFMKEQRPKIAAEFTLKESAAINQILGKRWHALDKAEQAKYYELARKERAIHMQLYPGWSARDNYAQIGRKKKRPRDKNEEMNPKKCRARYGLDRQEQWCKPCRRKKKCIRFLVGADGETTEIPDKDQTDHSDSDDNAENKTQHPDTKENLQELVTMVAKDTPSSINNNNNNTETLISTNSILSNSISSHSSLPVISLNTTNSVSSSSTYTSAMEVISSGISLSLNTPVSPHVTFSANSYSLSNILTDKIMDNTHTKTIPATCP